MCLRAQSQEGDCLGEIVAVKTLPTAKSFVYTVHFSEDGEQFDVDPKGGTISLSLSLSVRARARACVCVCVCFPRCVSLCLTVPLSPQDPRCVTAAPGHGPALRLGGLRRLQKQYQVSLSLSLFVSDSLTSLSLQKK